MCDEPVDGIQFAPPSVLSSVNTSKELVILNPPVTASILVWPNDCSVGLSRNIVFAGKLPPLMFSESSSVLNIRVPPTALTKVYFTEAEAGAWTLVTGPPVE